MAPIRIAGVDPGATTGLIAVELRDAAQISDVNRARQHSHDLAHARLICAHPITVGSSKYDSPPIRRAQLFTKFSRWLVQHQIEQVVFERPADVPLGGYNRGGGSRGKFQSQEVPFTLGNHYGLLEAAAGTLCDQVFAYPTRTRKARENALDQSPRIGWMQRREKKPIDRERILTECRELLRSLAQRPCDGVLREYDVGDDVFMALGVLAFHCDRERGKV